VTAVRPDRILAEFARLRDAESDPALEAVRTALLVEDVFGFTLSDGQINSETLGDAEALRNLIDASTTRA
jgi:hypothetical protein